MTLVEKFTAKYGINPIKLVEDANLEFFGTIKSLGLKKILEEYIDKKNLKIELTDEFFKELVECFAEAGEKFPENQKAPELVGASFEIPNQKVSIPKSKGTLENFKDIVGTDELRPIMMGVYVSEDGFLVGTDAHKLVKLRTNEFSSDKGKIIDLTKYIKSKGKILDFIDGKYPNYEAVIPKENLEEKALSTYAFYNLAKSAQDVKRLTSNEIFNINIRLKTEDDKTEIFAFSYFILLEALTFAMANGWDFFTLEYSTPNRAIVLNFGDGNIALVMPVMVRDNEARGAKIMTPEEIEENYRLGLSNQKASKSKATKPARPSAPIISEPYKEFEGSIKDTTYITRREIASITLTNGEVLSGNDIIDGVYRVNKKMAHGGGVDGNGSRKLSFKDWMESKGITVYKRTYYWVADDNGDDYMYVGANKTEVLNFLKEEWNREFESNNSKMAHGGGVDQDEPYSKNMYSDQDWESITRFLEKTYTPNQTDTILRSKFMRWVSGKKNFKNFVSYFNDSKKYIDEMLEEEGEYAHGGSMYADGGGVELNYEVVVKMPKGLITKKDFDGFTKKEIIDWCEERGWKYNQNGEKLGGRVLEDYEFFIKSPSKRESVILPKNKMAHGGGVEDNEIYALAEDLKNRLKGKGINVFLRQSKNGVFIYGEKNERGKYKYETYISFSETPENAKDFLSFEESEFERLHKFAHGGSMYADGGKIDPIDMSEIEKSAIFYTAEGKWSPEPTVEKFENEIKEYQELKTALDNKEITPSRIIGTGFKSQYARPLAYRWIEERTLIAKRAIEILKERMGGAKSSSHEVGDIVTFNSVMGGTKTGTIISKIGDEGFRIATSDGFATVKKSAIV